MSVSCIDLVRHHDVTLEINSVCPLCDKKKPKTQRPLVKIMQKNALHRLSFPVDLSPVFVLQSMENNAFWGLQDFLAAVPRVATAIELPHTHTCNKPMVLIDSGWGVMGDFTVREPRTFFFLSVTPPTTFFFFSFLMHCAHNVAHRSAGVGWWVEGWGPVLN